MKNNKNKETSLDKAPISIENKGECTKKFSAIRLAYASLEPFKSYASGELKIGQTYDFSSPFIVPNNMAIEDACKVVSYLSDKVESENGLEPACEQSVIMVGNILENYGFKRIEGRNKVCLHIVSEYSHMPFYKIGESFPECKKIQGVADLFTVGGDIGLFKKTDLSYRYFNWYTKGVTEHEVAEIYKKSKRAEEVVGNFKKNLETMTDENCEEC